MTYRLVTLLCMQIQPDDMTERFSLFDALRSGLEKNGGKLVTSTPDTFDIYLSESPTEAVLAGQHAIEQIDKVHRAQARIAVHTAEIDLDPSSLGSRLVTLVKEMPESTEWGNLLVSEATYLSLKLSEIRDIEQTSMRLKVEQRSLLMYRIKGESGKDLKATAKDFELASVMRSSRLAPYDRRVLATGIDYIVGLFLLLFCLIVQNFSGVWRVYSVRKILECADFTIENARKDLYWKASGGEVLMVGDKATLRSSVKTSPGYYDVELVYTRGNPAALVHIQIGAHKNTDTLYYNYRYSESLFMERAMILTIFTWPVIRRCALI